LARPAKIKDEHAEVLDQIVQSNPGATLGEIVVELHRLTGLKVHEQTLGRTLRRRGLQRIRSRRKVDRMIDKPRLPQYRRNPARQRSVSAPVYPYTLTDTEWDAIKDIFRNETGPGLPPRYSRRALLDACCYVVRTGGAWRTLPDRFPQWQNVYRTFRRWSDQGKFEQMHERLRLLWREREVRKDCLDAAAADTLSEGNGAENGFNTTL